MKQKSVPEKYEADITAARKAGGNKVQSHWLARLKAVMTRRAKAGKPPPTR